MFYNDGPCRDRTYDQEIGQQVADKTKLEIAHEIKKIEPNAHITVHYIPIENNRHMIVLEVPQGKHIPYVDLGRENWTPC
ncbi:MAG: hypothetical protein NTU48_00820 [Legionellales bacterium]|nr:hypothetical protein [Legionellales bacterium]